MDVSNTVHANNRLRQERIQRNWRQSDLAEQLGTTVGTVKRWERGSQQPSAYFRVKLCALFSKSAEELGFFPEGHHPPATPEIDIGNMRASRQQPHADEQARTFSQDGSAPPASPHFLTTTSGNALLLAERPMPTGGFIGARPEGVLAGRDEELLLLQRIIRAVKTEKGHLLMLAGEPGVGKTRLAQEASLLARSQQFFVAAGRCYEPHQAVAYYPFLEIFDTLSSALPPAVLANLSQRWSDLTRLFPDSPLPSPEARSASDREDQQRLFWTVTHFIQALAEAQPIALFLDDLQWADTASLMLLQHLAQHTRLSRVLLLGIYRDTEVARYHPLRGIIHTLAHEQLTERLVVYPLRLEGTAALVRATVEGNRLPEPLIALIHQRTGGNPFFTVELVRVLLEREAPSSRQEQGEYVAEEDRAVPESVLSAIDERLLRLSAESQNVLKAASVLGQTFSYKDLQEMQSFGEEDLEQALGEAVQAGLLREHGPEDYSFNHVITQQVLYQTLPLRQRRRQHRRAGEALEHLPEQERRRRVAELAWHFLEANERGKALPYVLLAGMQAEALYAHAEAERRYRKALELAREAGDREQEQQARWMLGRVLVASAHYDEAIEFLEASVEAFHAANNFEVLGQAAAQLGRAYAERGTPQEGIARLQSVGKMLEEQSPSPGRIAVYAALATLYFIHGQYTEQLLAGDRAVELSITVGSPSLLARARGTRGLALAALGQTQKAIAEFEETVHLAEAGGDIDTLARTLSNLAGLYSVSGNFAKSCLYYARALEVAERLGNPAQVVHVLCNYGEIAFRLGEWGQARAHFERAAMLSQQVGKSWAIAFPRYELGVLSLAEGDWDTASHLLEETLAQAQQNGDLLLIRATQTALAELDLQQGHPAAAYDRLQPLYDESRLDELYIISLLPFLARALLELGEEERAGAVIVRVVQRMRAENNGTDLAEALLVQTLITLKQAHWTEAQAFLEELLTLSRAMPYPYAEARALLLSADLAVQQNESERASAFLEAALVIFKRLGARYYTQKAKHMLRDRAEAAKAFSSPLE